MFLILLGILFGTIIAGLSYLKQIGIRTINSFRIRSIEQNPVFDELLKLQSQETGYWERFGYRIDGVSYP